MLAGTRGYLALGEQQYLDEYEATERDFSADLAQLASRSGNLDATDRQRLSDLQILFSTWSALPHAQKMTSLAGRGIFALQFPNHKITGKLKQVAKEVYW